MSRSIELDVVTTERWLQSIRKLSKLAHCETEGLHNLEPMRSLAGAALRLVLVGAPKVGKSSLINRLIQRRLLPISALPCGHTFAVECTEHDRAEKFTAAGIEHPLSELGSWLSLEGSTFDVSIRVNDEWLMARQLTLIERPALDEPEPGLGEAIHRSLRGADIVLLTIDALTPVRRLETVVVSECSRRGLPIIVVVTKIDRIAPDELASVSDYVKKQIHTYAESASMVELGINTTETTGVDALKEAIDDELASADFQLVRFRQSAEEFLHALDHISVKAAAALELQSKSAEERAGEHRRRQLASDEQATLWADIENQLQSRRRDLDEKIRKGLESKSQSVVELLMHDLEGRTDIKTWWARELPFRLNRELRTVAESLSGIANRQIANDLRWLQSELSRCFRLPQSAPSLESLLAFDPAEVPKKDIELRDTNNMRIVTRVGQAAAMLAGGRLLFTHGLGSATLGLSILAGLAAEQAIILTAKNDRDKVRPQLKSVVEKASLEYRLEVSRKLKAGYDEVVEALKEQERRWQSAQRAALTMLQDPASGKESNWQAVVEQCKTLEQEIRTATVAAVPTS